MQLSTLIACCTFPVLVKASDDNSVIVQELSEGTWDQLVPKGKEVDAIYGDTVLQNQFIRAVIAKPVSSRNANMTIRNVGGCLIDLTTREHESDQLGAFFPGRRAFRGINRSQRRHISLHDRPRLCKISRNCLTTRIFCAVVPRTK
jgi:hypothetical protein